MVELLVTTVIIAQVFVLPLALSWRAIRRSRNLRRRSRPLRAWDWSGIGWRYFAWQHREEPVADAVLWMTFLYVPIVPIQKQTVFVHTDPNDPTTQRTAGIPLIMPAIRFEDVIEPRTILTLSWREIWPTYLWAYLFIPCTLLWPAPLLFWLIRTVDERFANNALVQDHLSDVAAVLLLLYGMLYIPIILAHQLHLSRGARPRRKDLRSPPRG